MNVLPPPLSFNKTVLRGTLRLASSETVNINSCLTKTVSWSEILIGVWGNLRVTFAEIKLSKIQCWITPGLAMNINGLQCLIVCPAQEFEVDGTKIKFSSLGSVPGSVVKKVFQTVYREWHPTSPFERGWHKTDSTEPIFRFLYMTTNMKQNNTIDESSFAMEMTLDIHIKARGLGGSVYKEMPSILSNVPQQASTPTSLTQLCLSDESN